jgi:hypothetical protein
MTHGKIILKKRRACRGVGVTVLRSLERGKKISRGANVTFNAGAERTRNADGGSHEKTETTETRGPVSGFISAGASGSISGVRNDASLRTEL